MSATKFINVQGKGPVTQTRSGRFEVSIWHWKKVIPQPDGVKDLFAEREVDVHRACIRYSRWNRADRMWQEAIIWCDIEDLRSLSEAIESLTQEESVGE